MTSNIHRFHHASNHDSTRSRVGLSSHDRSLTGSSSLNRWLGRRLRLVGVRGDAVSSFPRPELLACGIVFVVGAAGLAADVPLTV